MRKTRFASALAPLSALAACTSANSGSIPVDDSYTVSSRYLANRDAHPELKLPTLATVAGQRLAFDRLYSAVGGRELHLDIFLPPPAVAKSQGVVLIHGGAWRSGNKSNFYAVANVLAQRGYAVFLPELRLAPEAGYPAGLVDINSALRWVADHAQEFGIDPARISLGGESSGGQMASLVAYTGGSRRFTGSGEEALRVEALIDIDGVLDMTTPMALKHENAAGANSSFARWIGGSWEQRPEAWKMASAATYAGPDSPPTLILSGEDPRFTAGKEVIFPNLDQHGIAHREVHFAGLPHTFWLFEPYATEVADAIDDFLQTIGSEQ